MPLSFWVFKWSLKNYGKQGESSPFILWLKVAWAHTKHFDVHIFGRRILYNSPPMPPDISREVTDLLLKLLQKDPKVRLGAKGAHEIQAHPFFKVRVISNSLIWYCYYYF